MTTAPIPSITDEQTAELEKLASKATPGQWWIDSHGHTMVSLDDCQPIFSAKDLIKPAVRHPETGNLSHWPNDWDASYIATANPANILALISRLRAAERDAARWRFVRDKQTFIWMVQDWFKPDSGFIDVDAIIDEAMSEAKP